MRKNKIYFLGVSLIFHCAAASHSSFALESAISLKDLIKKNKQTGLESTIVVEQFLAGAPLDQTCDILPSNYYWADRANELMAALSCLQDTSAQRSFIRQLLTDRYDQASLSQFFSDCASENAALAVYVTQLFALRHDSKNRTQGAQLAGLFDKCFALKDSLEGLCALVEEICLTP